MTEETNEEVKEPIEYGRFLNITETKIIDEYIRRGYYIDETYHFDSTDKDVMFVQLIKDNNWRVGPDRRVKENL